MASLVIIGAGFFTAPNGHRGATGNMLRTTSPNGFASIWFVTALNAAGTAFISNEV